jgi:hypothetical protein
MGHSQFDDASRELAAWNGGRLKNGSFLSAAARTGQSAVGPKTAGLRCASSLPRRTRRTPKADARPDWTG